MSREVRRRVTLGIGIPLAAFLFLGVLVVAFSRILLAVPKDVAPWIALLFAVNILVGCALAATVRGTRGFTFLVAVLVGTIAVGGVAGFVLGERPVHSLVEDEEHAGAAQGGTQEQASPEPTGPSAGGGGGEPVPVAANNLAFDTDQLELPAGGEVVILFENQEAVPHNLSVYTSPGGEALFQGEVVSGPTEVEYRFPAPAPGSYHFQCDLHPTTMSGTVTVG